jgi:diguanylate cyclase (GGDEF)-like protein
VTSTVITILALLTWHQGLRLALAVASRWVVSMLAANGTVAALSGFTHGMRKAFSTQLNNAIRDPLTRLLNRRGLEMEAIQLLRTSFQSVGFIIIDLDGFKLINDTHGHEAGDTVLALAAERLRRTLGADATVARTGGEEFAVVVKGSEEKTCAVAENVCTILRDENDAIPITVSIGVSTVGDDECHDPVDALRQGLRRADVALYEAKRAGRNRVRTYQPVERTETKPT